MSAYQIEFVPVICKPRKAADGAEVPAKFEGKVIMRMPSYDERQELQNDSVIEDAIVAVAQKGLDGAPVDDKAIEAATMRKQILDYKRMLQRVAKALPKFIVSLEVKRLEDGFTFKTFEDVSHDSDMDALIIEMSTKLISKFNVGKTNSAT